MMCTSSQSGDLAVSLYKMYVYKPVSVALVVEHVIVGGDEFRLVLLQVDGHLRGSEYTAYGEPSQAGTSEESG